MEIDLGPIPLMPLPRLVGGIIADVIRHYRIIGCWRLAITAVLVGLLNLIACYRGVCSHG